jgi:hypothetical protein
VFDKSDHVFVLSEDDDDSATAVNLMALVAVIQAMAVEHG